MSYLEPWEERTESERPDRLKRFVYQAGKKNGGSIRCPMSSNPFLPNKR